MEENRFIDDDASFMKGCDGPPHEECYWFRQLGGGLVKAMVSHVNNIIQ